MSSPASSFDPATTTATSTPLVLTTRHADTAPSVTSQTAVSASSSASTGAASTRPPSLTSFDHLISGLTAGSVSTLLLHPFDLIKTRLQASPPTNTKLRTTSASSLSILRTIVREEGAKALWKGISPNFIGNTIAWGSYFFLYNTAKQRYQQLVDRQQLTAVEYLGCAALSGSCVAALTNPVWVVKTRMFLDSRAMAQSDQRLLPALLRLYREEGVRGLYRGFFPSVLGVSHGAVQFMTYEVAKQRLLDYKRRSFLLHSATSPASAPPSFTPLDTVGLAIASKVTAAVTTYPYQVIRTQLQDKRVQPPLAGTLEAVKYVWAGGGVRGLYRGVVVGTLKVIPSACVVFVVYEETEKFLKRRAMTRQVGQQQQLAQQYVSNIR